jgi:hypothetical protein
MAKRNEPYRDVIVESYYPSSTAGLHGPIHIRPIEGQPFPTHLHVECSKDLSDPTKYPVGTRFRISAKADRSARAQRVSLLVFRMARERRHLISLGANAVLSPRTQK